MVGTAQYKIRLEGIDAPELGQPYSKRAKQTLSKYVFGKSVQVQVTGQDKYKRTLGTVYVDGKSVNLQLVADGYAWHFKKYSDDKELGQAEVAARKARRGLWADPNAIAPWDWRNPPPKKLPANATGYWLNTSSGVRHSSKSSTRSEGGSARRMKGRRVGFAVGRRCLFAPVL